MKLKRYFFFICTSFLLLGYTSCSTDDGSLILVLDNTYVELQPNESAIVNITSGNGGYTVKSGNEQIATAKIDGNVITVTIKKEGSTTILVSDRENKQAYIYVDVPTISGEWIVYKYDAIVEAKDDETRKNIYDEIVSYTAIPSYISKEGQSKYTFIEDNTLQLLIGTKEGVTTQIGTYAKKENILNIAFSDKESVYEISRITKNILVLKEDLTEKYKMEHPNEDVTKVCRIHEMGRKLFY